MSLATTVARNIHGRAQTEEPLADLITKKAKLSVSYVSMMERGERKPTLDTLEALAKALGVPPLDLLQGRRARR